MSLYKSKRIEKWRSNVIIFFLMVFPFCFLHNLEGDSDGKLQLSLFSFLFIFTPTKPWKITFSSSLFFHPISFFSFPPPTTHCIRHVKKWDDSYVATQSDWMSWIELIHRVTWVSLFFPLFCQKPFSFYFGFGNT